MQESSLINARMIKGYNAVKAHERRDVFGGITFNDSYNLKEFGITRSEYCAVNRLVSDKFGAFPPHKITATHLRAR